MNTRDDYSLGAPCWVDTLQPDPRAALDFYGPLLGWSFDEAAPMPTGLGGDYFAARSAGWLVTGIGQGPASSAAVWSTYIRVKNIELALGSAEKAGGARLTGAMDAGSDGRLAVLTDATGVAFCLWQAGERIGAELVNEPGTWAMSALHTTNVERARAFYGAMFDWELEPVTGAPFIQWCLSGQVVAVVTETDGVTVAPHWSVNFAVRDADAIAERAAVLGGTVMMAPIDTPGFRSAVIADPQGGVISVSAPAR